MSKFLSEQNSILGVIYRSFDLKAQPKLRLLRSKTMPKHFNYFETPRNDFFTKQMAKKRVSKSFLFYELYFVLFRSENKINRPPFGLNT